MEVRPRTTAEARSTWSRPAPSSAWPRSDESDDARSLLWLLACDDIQWPRPRLHLRGDGCLRQRRHRHVRRPRPGAARPARRRLRPVFCQGTGCPRAPRTTVCSARGSRAPRDASSGATLRRGRGPRSEAASGGSARLELVRAPRDARPERPSGGARLHLPRRPQGLCSARASRAPRVPCLPSGPRECGAGWDTRGVSGGGGRTGWGMWRESAERSPGDTLPAISVYRLLTCWVISREAP